MSWPDPDRVLDTRGSFCPVPIIETSKAVKDLGPSRVLLVLATDPGIGSDMPVWCRGTGHEHLGTERTEGTDGPVYRSWVRTKAGG